MSTPIAINQLVRLEQIREAQVRIRGVATRTPILRFPRSVEADALYLKAENLQPTGAFKLRGAYNKIAGMTPEERSRGVISYSSGNHAQAVAFSAQVLGIKATIVMPRNAPKIKIEGTKSYGAEVDFVGPGSNERKERAEALAAEKGLTIIPPYNDEDIIAGQGTIGLEIIEDLADVDTVLVPISGGGLLSGVATAIKLSNPAAKVIGVEPELANDASQSLRAGKIIELPTEQTSRTVADGLRAQCVGEIPFEHIRKYVDDIITVSESEIFDAVRKLLLTAKIVSEPSGAVSSAAFFFHRDQLPKGKRTVAVVSGGSIEPELLSWIIQGA